MVILLFLLFAGNLKAEALPVSYKLFPLPVAETEETIIPWLKDSGFVISREPLKMGQILFSAARGEASWKILLKPHSPLTTEIWLESETEEPGDVNQFDGLWKLLNGYIDALANELDTPAESISLPVGSLEQTNVCIDANLGNNELQISGFFVDKSGLIISTAHNLTKLYKIKVLLHDRQEFDATLVKINPDKDLALLHIDYTPTAYISLLKGRNNFVPDERLFSASCLNNTAGNIGTGAIMYPPVNVNNQLLWMLSMKTLHGSSGSPVIDEKGNLLGLVKGRYRGNDSIGFMIPFETIMEFLNGV